MESSGSAKVSVVDALRSCQQKFEAQERMLSGLFSQLDSELDKLGNMGLSLSAKNDIVMSTEYLLVRLRSKLISELSSIQMVLSGGPAVAIQKAFKERLNAVLVYLARLNELRADFELIQRTRYTNNWRQ
jgi:hypothetical protein